MYLYSFIYLTARLVEGELVDHSIIPCTFKGGISASDISSLVVIYYISKYVSLNRLPLNTMAPCPVTLHLALLN